MERLREDFFITLFNYQNLSTGNVYFLPKKKKYSPPTHRKHVHVAKKERRIIIRNGAKTISLQTTFGRLNYSFTIEFHETWWSYRYMYLVGLKIFSFVIKGIKVIF
jgi:hypothetical protein